MYLTKVFIKKIILAIAYLIFRLFLCRNTYLINKSLSFLFVGFELIFDNFIFLRDCMFKSILKKDYVYPKKTKQNRIY